MSTDAPAVIEARGLVKTFPGVRALDRVDFAGRPGRVHAVVGENGAGKSTLVGILTGNTAPDEGEVLIDGEPVTFGGPRDALSRGITAVFQELTVLPAMSIADNVMLGQEPGRRGLLDQSTVRATAQAALDRVGLRGANLQAPAETLSLANQQLVEIARAIVRQSRLLILDEPSAVLAGDTLESLFELVRGLANDGVAVLYISHRLEEVGALANDVTILRDGQRVSSGPAGDYDTARMVREMVGRDVDTVFPSRPKPRERVVLQARGLVPAGPHADGRGVDLDVREGEVVALAGLLGSGRSRLLRTLAGAHPRQAGTVRVAGRPIRGSVRSAVRAGVVLVPEERKTEGLVLPLATDANISLASLRAVAPVGWMSARREKAVYAEEQSRLNIRASGPAQLVGQLSGGNQQKVVLAKWLRTQPKVLLLDEPTRGIDVGAKTEIYRIISELADRGLAVVFVSSDLPEVIGLADRVFVCRRGSVVGEAVGDQIDSEYLMHLALDTQEART